MKERSAQKTLKSEFETIYTVDDYWDGPLEGVADYLGKPHYYKCVFDEEREVWTHDFILTPIDSETLDLVLEAWAIWLRWETEFNKGNNSLDSHPALPEDRLRQEQLHDILATRLRVNSDKEFRVHGQFEAMIAGEHQPRSQARWRVLWTAK